MFAIPEMTADQLLGVVSILALFFAFLVYLLWNLKIKKRMLRRVAHWDMVLYKKHAEKYNDDMQNVFGTTAQVVSQIAPIAVAVLILGITLLGTWVPYSFQWYVNAIVVLVVSIASISYLFSTEQFCTLMSPCLSYEETCRLYEEGVNLKFMGFFTMWGAVLVSMLLVSPYVVIVSCVFTGILFYRHYEKRWERTKEVGKFRRE
jgi:hypothetical protein